MLAFRRLATLTAVLTYVLIVVGGIVRVSGSGLGCPDWPTCHGQIVPPLVLQSVIETSHRYTAGLVSIGIATTAVYAWIGFRRQRWVVVPALLAVALLLIQIALGAFTVELELTPALVTAHLGTALVVFATTIVTAAACWAVAPERHFRVDGFAALALVTALATFVLLLAGAFVIKGAASFSCDGWPLCGTGLQLPADDPATLNLIHRLVAIVASGLYLALVLRAGRSRPAEPGIGRLLLFGLALLIAQIAIGAGVVPWRIPPVTAALHLAIASAFWAAVVTTTFVSCFPIRSESRNPVSGVADDPTDLVPTDRLVL
jgi:heme A synthase